MSTRKKRIKPRRRVATPGRSIPVGGPIASYAPTVAVVLGVAALLLALLIGRHLVPWQAPPGALAAIAVGGAGLFISSFILRRR